MKKQWGNWAWVLYLVLTGALMSLRGLSLSNIKVKPFVGKGMTFDSGGYSLKTVRGMMKMETDMGGAASVLGAMAVIGELKPEANVMGVIPSTENMVNGSALKPGDGITASNGITIEVNNTDAEGRLILADALSYSVKQGAGRIVDLATLTGAILVTFGSITTGAVTNNDAFYTEFKTASGRADEWVWELPHHEPYKEMVKQSDVADLLNAPGRGAGSITAAMFLHEFVGYDMPWVHLDIAGTAFSDKPSDLGPKGATGVMVRTLAELARAAKQKRRLARIILPVSFYTLRKHKILAETLFDAVKILRY